jgi:hypothetical protein
MTELALHRPKKGRSPSYPGIDLGSAVVRASVLYDRIQRHEAPMSAITGYWGFSSPKTGPAAVTYAAVKKFGLLEETGRGDDRMGRLTALALDILVPADHDSLMTAVRTAALNPPIHAELWEKYRQAGGLPTDEVLRHELVRNRAFTENGATEFIREFRDTIAYSQLANGAIISGHDESKSVEIEAPATLLPSQSTAVGGSMVLTIPLAAGKLGSLTLPASVTETDWEQMLTVLGAMKPGIVTVQVDEEMPRPQ